MENGNPYLSYCISNGNIIIRILRKAFTITSTKYKSAFCKPDNHFITNMSINA